MRNLLEFLLIHLVDFPDAVSVTEEEISPKTYTYTITVHPDDMGRVIGKNGAVIDAIRKVAKIRAVKEGVRATINLAEPVEAATEAAPVEQSETTEVVTEEVAE